MMDTEIFKVVEGIKSGAFGNVLKAYNTLTNENIAIKEVIINFNSACKQNRIEEFNVNDVNIREIKNTIKILRKEMERTISLNLNNPFIMQIYGYNKKEEKIKYEIIEDSYIYHIYMELCDIDLHQFLVDNKETKHIDHIIIQIALGLQYLESNNLLHRDIKELNIILKDIAPELDINDGRRYRAKISDLDFLREIPSSNDKMTFVGTNGYMSPLTRDGKNDIKRDIYSFGIIIENLYKQKRLDERWKDIYKKLKDNDIKRRMTIKEFIEFIDNLNETKEEEIESLFYMVDKSFIDDSPLILLIIKEEIMKNKKFLNKFMPLFESLWEKFIGNILEEQVNDPLESLYLTSLKEVSRNILLLSKNDNGNQNLSLLSIDKARICLNYVLKRIEKESLKDDPEFIKSFGINVNRIEKALLLIEKIKKKISMY